MSHQPRTPTRSHHRQIQGYSVRVAGHLEENPLEGPAAALTNQPGGDALFSGIADQAALMRALLHLHEMGLTILSVKPIMNRR